MTWRFVKIVLNAEGKTNKFISTYFSAQFLSVLLKMAQRLAWNFWRRKVFLKFYFIQKHHKAVITSQVRLEAKLTIKRKKKIKKKKEKLSSILFVTFMTLQAIIEQGNYFKYPQPCYSVCAWMIKCLSCCQWCLVPMQCYINNGVVKAACEAGVRGEGEKHARERAIHAGEKMPFRSDVQLKGSL